MNNGPEQFPASLCEPILRELKAWFGIESSIQEYLRNIPLLDTFVEYDGQGAPAGFLTVKQHFTESAEIYAMGVRNRRQGLGRRLLQRAEEHLVGRGVRVLQVKTLAADVDYPPYEETRAFYRACGFLPIEVFRTLWDEKNPCLVLVKFLAPA